MKQLAWYDEVDVRVAIAKRPDLPSELLDRLGRDPDARVRLCIARRSDLPLKLIERLCADPVERVRSVAVREAIARNPGVHSAQAGAASDPEPEALPAPGM